MPASLSHAAAPWSSGDLGYAPALSGRQYYTVDEWLSMHGVSTGLGGLGDAQTVAMQAVSSAPSIIAGLTPLFAHGAAAGAVAAGAGTGAATTAATASLTVPIIGLAIAGVTLALVALFSRKGPKQKVATTEIVNKVEPLLKQNLAGYMAGPRTVSSQAQALANFDAGWQYVVDNCGIPAMGNPGKLCVSERQPGGKWDWYSYYRDPIANDTQVKPDPVVDQVGNLIDSVTGGIFKSTSGGGGGMGWLLLAGLAVAGVFLLGDSK
jgi:hypothetical protein